jgi:hypothetical protein
LHKLSPHVSGGGAGVGGVLGSQHSALSHFALLHVVGSWALALSLVPDLQVNLGVSHVCFFVSFVSCSQHSALSHFALLHVVGSLALALSLVPDLQVNLGVSHVAFSSSAERGLQHVVLHALLFSREPLAPSLHSASLFAAFHMSFWLLGHAMLHFG